eukprot:3857889-Amphidinium_carterae.1
MVVCSLCRQQTAYDGPITDGFQFLGKVKLSSIRIIGFLSDVLNLSHSTVKLFRKLHLLSGNDWDSPVQEIKYAKPLDEEAEENASIVLTKALQRSSTQKELR